MSTIAPAPVGISPAEAQRLRRGLPAAGAAHRAADAAAVMADPTRLVIAAVLRDAGSLCVTDLACVAGRTRQLVSHHARALRAAGLADAAREGKMMVYQLTPAGCGLLDAVLRVDTHPRRPAAD